MREDFLAAIIADPADDTKRLIYADWLEENGEGERAEFIRGQIENGLIVNKTVPWGDCKIKVPTWGVPKWLNNKDEMKSPIYWRRGFVYKFQAPLSIILEYGPRLCRTDPVEAVEVTDKEPLPVPRPAALGTNTPGFCWTDERNNFHFIQACLPDDIRKMCPGTYRQKNEAIAKLNAAVLATIRERASKPRNLSSEFADAVGRTVYNAYTSHEFTPLLSR